jgi:hypothetical protein
VRPARKASTQKPENQKNDKKNKKQKKIQRTQYPPRTTRRSRRSQDHHTRFHTLSGGPKKKRPCEKIRRQRSIDTIDL